MFVALPDESVYDSVIMLHGVQGCVACGVGLEAGVALLILFLPADSLCNLLALYAGFGNAQARIGHGTCRSVLARSFGCHAIAWQPC